MSHDEIINEIKDNNFFENADINYKLNFMLKSIDIIINQSKQEYEKWNSIHDSYQPGFYNKAFSELCLHHAKDALESANSARNNIKKINDINNELEVKYYMFKYNKDVINVSKLNIIIKNISSKILTEDMEISDNESDEDNLSESDG
jgi:hypothetical protein